MPYQNVSAYIDDSTKQEIINRLNEISRHLPFLINLTPEERRAIPKMGDKTIAFVEKAIEFIKANPQLVPPYVDVNELERDFKLAVQFRDIVTLIDSLSEKISDTYLAAGSEAYITALAFYNSVKSAAKMNVPGTDTIADELSERFEKNFKAKPSQPS